jgi:hypothetical protein
MVGPSHSQNCLRRTKRQVSWTKPRKLLRDIPHGRGCDVAIGSCRKSVRRVGVAGNGLGRHGSCLARFRRLERRGATPHPADEAFFLIKRAFVAKLLGNGLFNTRCKNRAAAVKAPRQKRAREPYILYIAEVGGRVSRLYITRHLRRAREVQCGFQLVAADN